MRKVVCNHEVAVNVFACIFDKCLEIAFTFGHFVFVSFIDVLLFYFVNHVVVITQVNIVNELVHISIRTKPVIRFQQNN
jgi:hypothetical protein